MIDKYKIKGTPELYTIAVNSSSQTGDWNFACNVYRDMTKKGVIPDEVLWFLIKLLTVVLTCLCHSQFLLLINTITIILC